MKFTEIPSHEKEKRLLRQMVSDRRIPHALLLHGPAGTGKFMLARAFAQYVHCVSPGVDGEPCGVCASCRQHNSFNHPDIAYVFPVVKNEGNKRPISEDFMEDFRDYIGRNPFMDFEKWAGYFDKKTVRPMIYAEESKRLEERMSITALSSDWKIVLLWLPELLGEEAANKLLKLIEEPSDGSLFVLVSNDAASILPTIRSRCRPLEVGRLADADIAEWLAAHLAMDSAEAMAVAHVAEGSVNAALKSLDAASVSRMYFDLFVRLMRLAYMRDVKGMKEWGGAVAELGRESAVRFFEYCTRLIRENFIYNFQIADLNYLNSEEEKFSRNFARFVTEKNAERIIRAMDRAAVDIAGNASAKIVCFDFAVKMIILIKEGVE